MLILILVLVVVVIAVLGMAGSSRPDDLGDNDLTGSNANFGKSLMGDDDEFGKGL